MIEPVTVSDFERLFEIEQQAHSVPWSKGTLLNNQGENYLNLKLTIENQIVGFVICQTVLDEATLFNIAISPDFQQKGYGKRLLEVLILQLQHKNITTLWLEVRKSNVVAQQLYQKMGFNEVTLRKNYYPMPNGGREDAVIMARYFDAM